MPHLRFGTWTALLLLLCTPVAARAEDGDDLAARRADSLLNRFTFDAGVATSINAGPSAYELHGGANFFIYPWLSWRNSPFFRGQSGFRSEYGIDTSIQGKYEVNLTPDLKGNVLLGAGYRFVVPAPSDAPFVELGFGSHFLGVDVSISFKRLLYQLMSSGMEDENQITANVGGKLNFLF